MIVWRAGEHDARRSPHMVELEVWPDSERAISLFASYGFEVEGVRRDHYRRRRRLAAVVDDHGWLVGDGQSRPDAGT